MRVNKREAILISLFVITVLSICFAFSVSPKNYFKVSFLDIGQGDSVLFQTPNGGKFLIDGGHDKTVLTKLGEELPLNEKNIDFVIATHDDSDHIAGLVDVLKSYHVKVLLYSLPNSESVVSKNLIHIASEKNVKVVQIVKPMIIKSEDGVIVKILFPVKNMDGTTESNDASVVTQVEFGKTKFLLTGDLPQTGEILLVKKYGDILKSDVLKLGHHGSDTSTNLEFLQTVQPELAIVSAGKNNSFSHPHKSVLDLVEKFGIKVLRTDEFGTINLYSNGLNIWKN